METIFYTVENKFSAPVETVGNTTAGNSLIENITTANSIAWKTTTIGNVTIENPTGGNR